MEVILLERIEKIGKLGDVVKVKDGYARNYLLPQKKALRANKENIEVYEKQKKKFQEKNDKLLKSAQDIAKKINNLSVSIIKQASDSGQLYGSVAAREISDSLKQLGHEVQTKQIQLNNVIKTIGIHEVKIVIHPEVISPIKVKVARSDEELISNELLKETVDKQETENNQSEDKESKKVGVEKNKKENITNETEQDEKELDSLKKNKEKESKTEANKNKKN